MHTCLLHSKKFRTGPFEQAPQDLKNAPRARAKMKPKFFFFWRARARRVLGLEGSVKKALFEISLIHAGSIMVFCAVSFRFDVVAVDKCLTTVARHVM